MWQMVWNHEIQSLFQMEQQSGIQGIALTKPESVDDLAVLNSVIRLMAQSKDEEQPLVKYARFKSDINHWYKELTHYGLGEAEKKLLEPIVGLAYGICESQEKFMQLVQLPECGGFDLTWADKLRKAVAKKNPAEYDKLTTEYFERAKEKELNIRLCNYVWNVLVATSRGYGFNASHTLAYSLVALQEMNLAFKFPVIFWNCACLITDSGSNEAPSYEDEEEGIFYEEEQEEIENIFEPEDFEEYEYKDSEDKQTKTKKKRTKTTDYKKIAVAIGKMMAAGIKIVPPDINASTYTFSPDVENNQIFFGLSGLLNVGEDVIIDIIKNRPYNSIKDFVNKVKPKHSAMISLIKVGAFDKMEDRKFAMTWYLWETCDKKTNLTLQNMSSLIKYDLLPNDTEEYALARRVYEFNRYLKSCLKYSDISYKLDLRAINFLTEISQEHIINSEYLISIKTWDKIYQSYMDSFRYWIRENKEDILKELNSRIFKEDWDKYAKGSISAWEMEVMCYYYHEHELAHINYEKYGLRKFSSLTAEPLIERTFKKGGKTINLFKLDKICGTCIAKDKNKGHITLLTTDGVVTVKFRKEYFAMFDKQISVKNPDGKSKTVIEKSWFNRGSMIIIQGMRSGDTFIAKKYNSSGGHQLYKIASIDSNGDITLQTERKAENAEI